jgi:selenide,water dikinase
VPEGSYNNARFLRDGVTWASDISQEAQMILYDAQTSGGCLLSTPPQEVDTLVTALEDAGVSTATVIGEVIEPKTERISPGQIIVESSKKEKN